MPFPVRDWSPSGDRERLDPVGAHLWQLLVRDVQGQCGLLFDEHGVTDLYAL